MANTYKRRRVTIASLLLTALIVVIVGYYNQPAPVQESKTANQHEVSTGAQDDLAVDVLQSLPIKGRAPKTDYNRAQFGDGWKSIGSCDMRNIILNRDLTEVEVDDKCNVIKGTLDDPYTGKLIQFERGSETSSAVQIDHVVALSDAWQKGAQQLDRATRVELANDPLELIAVDGLTNQKKSDGDAATWLPPNKSFRCQYVARQIAVKKKYLLWVTQAEYDVIKTLLTSCPQQTVPTK